MSTTGYTLTPHSAARLESLIGRLVTITKRSSLMALAKEIQQTYRQDPPPLDPREPIAFILSQACAVFALHGIDLANRFKYSSRSDRSVSKARFLASYWLTYKLGLSTTLAARVMKLKDHTSVIYARQRMKEMIESDPQIARAVAFVEPEIDKVVRSWRENSKR